MSHRPWHWTSKLAPRTFFAWSLASFSRVSCSCCFFAASALAASLAQSSSICTGRGRDGGQTRRELRHRSKFGALSRTSVTGLCKGHRMWAKLAKSIAPLISGHSRLFDPLLVHCSRQHELQSRQTHSELQRAPALAYHACSCLQFFHLLLLLGTLCSHTSCSCFFELHVTDSQRMGSSVNTVVALSDSGLQTLLICTRAGDRGCKEDQQALAFRAACCAHR